MNENIGAKGGKNDRKRSLKIKKAREQELLKKKKLKKLESDVKKKQRRTLITVIPLTIIGLITSVFVEKSKKEDPIKKNPKEQKKSEEKQEKIEQNEQEVKKEEVIKKQDLEPKEQVFEIEEVVEEELVKEDIPSIKKKPKYIGIEEKLDKKIEDAKYNRVVGVYEDRLKDLRIKLRESYYEEDIIKEARSLEDDPSEENLEKLNALIDKLEELREKIKYDDEIFDVEDNYITTLAVEDIQKVEDSTGIVDKEKEKLYKGISTQIEIVKKIEENVREKVEFEKEKNEIDEEQLEKLKEKNDGLEKYQQMLAQFQNEEELILNKVRDQMKFEVNILERQRIQLNGMNKLTSLTLATMTTQMKRPGVRGGKAVLTFAVSYLYYMTLMNAINPKKDKYKKIQITDFSKGMEADIKVMENLLGDITKSTDKIDDMLGLLKSDYYKYSDTLEYKQLLQNLEDIKKRLEEKEYEIQKLKAEHEMKLQQGLAKVKTL